MNMNGLVLLFFVVVAVIELSVDGQEQVAPSAADEKPVKYSIVIHGGARSSSARLSAEKSEAFTSSLKQALSIGQGILEKGGTSLDAVEKVIRFMEDDPLFNAGHGAVFNSKGGHELDASIMDGRDRSCGAVAGVMTVRHPISLSRLVMTKTRHVLLAGDGAEQFAREMKVELVDADQKYFWTQDKFNEWQRVKNRDAAKPADIDPQHKGTVGCAALDTHGNLAAGTSTGGLTNKKFGRVGDSPIIGAGTYADNRTCAVSCTGIGEHFIRNAVAFDVSALMRYRLVSVEQAAKEVIHETLKPGDGGLIAVDKDGNITMQFNTPGMLRGAANSSGRFEVMIGGPQ